MDRKILKNIIQIKKFYPDGSKFFFMDNNFFKTILLYYSIIKPYN